MLDERGTVRIMDFGLSGTLSDVQGAVREGTPAYMAPEHAPGSSANRGLSIYDLFNPDGRDRARFRVGMDRRLIAGAFKTARKALLTASEVGNASATSG